MSIWTDVEYHPVIIPRFLQLLTQQITESDQSDPSSRKCLLEQGWCLTGLFAQDILRMNSPTFNPDIVMQLRHVEKIRQVLSSSVALRSHLTIGLMIKVRHHPIMSHIYIYMQWETGSVVVLDRKVSVILWSMLRYHMNLHHPTRTAQLLSCCRNGNGPNNALNVYDTV